MTKQKLIRPFNILVILANFYLLSYILNQKLENLSNPLFSRKVGVITFDTMRQIRQGLFLSRKELKKYRNKFENPHKKPLTPQFETKYVCCYKDPSQPSSNELGRPIPLTHKAVPIYEKYMKSKPINWTDTKFLNTTPQPVTGFSLNHLSEHKQRIEAAINLFNNQTLFGQFWPQLKIIVYDLDWEPKPELVNYVKNHPNLIYRNFEFEKYPAFVKTLPNYSWKTIIWSEILQEYGSIFWFDTSIDFSPITDLNFDFEEFHIKKNPINRTIIPEYFSRNAVKNIIQKHVINRKTSFLYYLHTAGHGISWGSSWETFQFFPSNLSELNGCDKFVHGGLNKDRFIVNYETPYNKRMPQPGGVMIWNTEELKNNIMKWGLACALSADCMQPASTHIYYYSITHERYPNGTTYDLRIRKPGSRHLTKACPKMLNTEEARNKNHN